MQSAPNAIAFDEQVDLAFEVARRKVQGMF